MRIAPSRFGSAPPSNPLGCSGQRWADRTFSDHPAPPWVGGRRGRASHSQELSGPQERLVKPRSLERERSEAREEAGGSGCILASQEAREDASEKATDANHAGVSGGVYLALSGVQKKASLTCAAHVNLLIHVSPLECQATLSLTFDGVGDSQSMVQ